MIVNSVLSCHLERDLQLSYAESPDGYGNTMAAEWGHSGLFDVALGCWFIIGGVKHEPLWADGPAQGSRVVPGG